MVVTEGEHHFWSASHATCMRILKNVTFAQSGRRCFSLFATAVLMDGGKWRFTRTNVHTQPVRLFKGKYGSSSVSPDKEGV